MIHRPMEINGPALNIDVDTEIPVYQTEGSNVAGRRRSQNFSEEGKTSGTSYDVGAQERVSTNMSVENN
jgi:hypothetical protein